MQGVFIDGQLTSREEAIQKLAIMEMRFDEAYETSSYNLGCAIHQLRNKQSKTPYFVHEARHHLHELRKVLNDVIGIVDQFSEQAEAEDAKEASGE